MSFKTSSTLANPQTLKQRVNKMLNWIPYFSFINCNALIKPGNEEEVQDALTWFTPRKMEEIWKDIEASSDQCKALKSFYVFPEKPFSQEEAEFPLAYAAIIHKDMSQVGYMISAFYHPQNVFVLVVDGDSPVEFKTRVDIFENCFENIHVIHTMNITWCGYGVARGVMEAVKYLSQLDHPWKYFQYLSGVDLPLKTNLEMVRIFKELDGAFISEINDFQSKRLKGFKKTPPLKLFKSSLSATFSRESADFMTNSTVVAELLGFLENTICPDESIWSTIAGNPDILPMPGGFNATALLKAKKISFRLLNMGKKLPSETYKPGPGETFVPAQYYISRYQVWNSKARCKGQMVTGSCAFGIGDLPELVRRPELVAHKLYMGYQPAAYFCLLKHHWRRALNLTAQSKFSAKGYSAIAQVQNLHGVPPEKLMFYRPYRVLVS
ncbi:hypothetical protein FO519_009275 [Halicephalobus sp. NKZ332]|nr:hypothetical protein FO519_009275 [Halicephalobus sp. NKZ332]